MFYMFGCQFCKAQVNNVNNIFFNMNEVSVSL